MIKYSVEPSDKPQFEQMITAETNGHEYTVCYINPVFQNSETLAFIIKDLLTNSKKIPDLTI